MATRAPEGTTLLMRASGEQSDEAVDALRQLVERNFDEEHTDASPG